ncbi:D-hexose-6-phosphate mutarotase [Phycicoccus sp.]|uniref:D-hexose-6-phosphate mutarotase n=1 Tax=Phycicoccus sp. TaxID=1902410 RepID=UPI002CB86CF9|nr:D-hexose-6-phosphate mutarotase [Phycicoccus sp.]HMM95088.1 D-hexose-6-phosphate mutarotase [Phycicoccus sp.]
MSADAPLRRTVDGGDCTGELLDEGALVLRWAPLRAAPVLFAHPSVPVRPGVPPHAGIPVCWPWFGPGRSGRMTPSHGWARSTVWSFVGEDVDTHETTLRMRLTSDDATDPQWPHPYRLDLVARLGARLEVSLSTTNTGAEPVELEEALHAYLAVGDVRQVSISGLDGAAFHDKVTGRDEVQDGDLVLTGETDRVYRSDAPVTVTDPVLGRVLRVETEGAADRVVWNPGPEKGPGVADVGDQWPRFVCVEAANALDDAVTVGPGETRTMTYRLTVEDL